jgi:tetratricopeptide (TPR) repeat protein
MEPPVSELLAHSDFPTGQHRKAVLAQAHRLTTNRDERRAISLYRRLLMEDPGDVQVALRLAPLLAQRGEEFEAWRLFGEAGRRLLRARRNEQALAVFREACRYLPHQFDAWRIRAEIELKLGWEETALETLLDGRQRFRPAHCRAQAIALLCMARSVEPWEPSILLDLARLYTQNDQVEEAFELLVALSIRTHGSMKRRVRGAQLRITYSPRHLGLWVKALWDEAMGSDERYEAHARYVTVEDPAR